MRQVKLEDLAKESNVKFKVTREVAEKVIKKVKDDRNFLLNLTGVGYMYWENPKDRKYPLSYSQVKDSIFFVTNINEEIELICQDFQTVAGIWVWLLAKEGNGVRWKRSNNIYTLKNGKIHLNGKDISSAKGTFTDQTNYSKVSSWEDKLLKGKPLLCWVGSTEGSIVRKVRIAKIISYSGKVHNCTNGRVYKYATPLSNEELLVFLETYKDIVCE